jgi:K+-transporting ATPase ATPase C chain
MGTTIRLTLVTLLGCAVIHPAVVLALARVLAPEQAEGSLLRDDAGRIIGSELLAQRFERDDYLWPRPSAADYDAAAAAGSNLASNNPALRERVQVDLVRLGASTASPVPAELVTASGSGLDPHVTLAGALHQASRIAAARHVAVERVEEALRSQATRPGLVRPALVNVLQANLALDRELGRVRPMPAQTAADANAGNQPEEAAH